MPTGYTAGVEDGTVTSFREFALTAARAFGACMELRDLPLGPIDDHTFFSPDSHYSDRVQSAIDLLDELNDLSDEEWEKRCEDHNDQNSARYRELRDKNDRVKDRYDHMIEEVKAWTPPTVDHVHMKDWMLDQLVSSRKFDTFDSSGQSYLSYLDPIDVDTYRSRQLDMATSGLESARKSLDEHLKSVEERNNWIKELVKSLPEE